MPVPVARLKELRSSPFLSACGEEDFAALAAAMDEVPFPRDARLYEQGAAGDALHLILSGTVGVVRTAGDAPRAAKARPLERILAMVGPGECVGEMALIDGEPRSATVVAVEDVVTAQLTRARYESLRGDARQGIRLALGLFRLVSGRIRQVNKAMEHVHMRIYAT